MNNISTATAIAQLALYPITEVKAPCFAPYPKLPPNATETPPPTRAPVIACFAELPIRSPTPFSEESFKNGTLTPIHSLAPALMPPIAAPNPTFPPVIDEFIAPDAAPAAAKAAVWANPCKPKPPTAPNIAPLIAPVRNPWLMLVPVAAATMPPTREPIIAPLTMLIIIGINHQKCPVGSI